MILNSGYLRWFRDLDVENDVYQQCEDDSRYVVCIRTGKRYKFAPWRDGFHIDDYANRLQEITEFEALMLLAING